MTTLDPGEDATVTTSLSGNTVHLEFGIPRGADGTPGEVTVAQMDAAIADAVADAVAGTSSNSNAVGTLDTSYADPDAEQIRQRFNELVLALRR